MGVDCVLGIQIALWTFVSLVAFDMVVWMGRNDWHPETKGDAAIVLSLIVLSTPALILFICVNHLLTLLLYLTHPGDSDDDLP